MLVLGSKREGAARQVTIGSVSRQMLGHAAYYLALGSHGLLSDGALANLGRIAIGYDGGPNPALRRRAARREPELPCGGGPVDDRPA